MSKDVAKQAYAEGWAETLTLMETMVSRARAQKKLAKSRETVGMGSAPPEIAARWQRTALIAAGGARSTSVVLKTLTGALREGLRIISLDDDVVREDTVDLCRMYRDAYGALIADEFKEDIDVVNREMAEAFDAVTSLVRGVPTDTITDEAVSFGAFLGAPIDSPMHIGAPAVGDGARRLFILFTIYALWFSVVYALATASAPYCVKTDEERAAELAVRTKWDVVASFFMEVARTGWDIGLRLFGYEDAAKVSEMAADVLTKRGDVPDRCIGIHREADTMWYSMMHAGALEMFLEAYFIHGTIVTRIETVWFAVRRRRKEKVSAHIGTGVCSGCGAEAAYACSKCDSTIYCSETCQKNDWVRGHVDVCDT